MLLLQKLLWLGFHPLMLQIVAIPGVVATVWDKKPPLNYTASSCHSRQRT